MMALSFGGIHLAYGLAVSITRARESRSSSAEAKLSLY
jgi:hypothetical protein